MKKTLKISLIFIAVIIFSNKYSVSQTNILYGMHNIPQTINTNPAKQPNCSFYLGFPALTDIYANINNNSLSINTIFEQRTDVPDSFFIDKEAILSASSKMNYFNIEENIALLNFGFRIGNGFYFSFGLSNKTFERFGYSKSVLELTSGNFSQPGIPINMNFYQNFTNYNEFAFGLSKQLFNNLTIGAKIKLLSGNVNLSSKKLDIDWYTEAAADSMNEWTFDTDISLRGSALIDWNLTYQDQTFTFTHEDINKETFSGEYSKLVLGPNTGFAFDFGAEYTLLNKLVVSASIIDLGYIKWQSNSQYLTQSGQFRFTGIDVGSYIESVDNALAGGDIGTEILDDLKDSIFTFLEPQITEKSYSTSLNTKIFIGANYFLTKNIDAGILYRGILYDKSLFSSYIFSMNTNFGKGWAFSANYSISKNTFSNLGLGLAYKIGPLQMYILTDNIAPAAWAINESDFTDNWIRNSKGVTFQLGLNFVVCKPKTDYGLIE